MLKSYEELRKINVEPYCEERDGLKYLPWTKVISLLHENGAKKVYYLAHVNDKGSSLFMSDKVFLDNKGVANQCYEVEIEVHVDDEVTVFRAPVLNGGNPVRDNSMSQLRVNNAQARAFVKCIALIYGLGWQLWCDTEEEEQKQNAEVDLSKHSLWAVKERMGQLGTKLMKEKNMSKQDVALALHLSGEEELVTVFGYFTTLDRIEKGMQALYDSKSR